MANPLARVVMANIARKSNLKDSSSKKIYSKNKDNKIRRTTFKSLDKLADEIRGHKVEKPKNSRDLRTEERDSLAKNNLSLKELELLSDTITGKVKVRTDTNTSTKSKNTLTLESLARNIKNNI